MDRQTGTVRPPTTVSGAPRIVLLTSLTEERCDRALESLNTHLVARDAAALRGISADILVSFATSTIVPPALYATFKGGAYNLHAASPEYPGRDPHHWAVYDQAQRYGATLHVMTERVDDGPIVDVEWFDVPPDVTPGRLLAKAETAALRLLQRVGPRLRRGEVLAPVNVRWTGKKHTRRDFLEMCEIRPDISTEEFERRMRAFDGEAYDNLITIVHGRRFRIDKRSE